LANYIVQEDGVSKILLETSGAILAENQGSGGVSADDSDSWWAGAQLCGSKIAIASAAAVVILGFYSQGSVSGAADEDYWQNPAPIQQAFVFPQPFQFEQNDFVPAAVTFQPDEDYWLVTLPAPPVQPLPKLTDGLEEHPLFIGTDEDFWRNPVAPNLWWSAGQPPWEQADQTFIHVDEDYWQRLTSWTQTVPSVFTDTDEIVPQPVGFQPDEDYWFGPSPNLWQIAAQPITDTDEPSGSLYGQYDEVYWQNPVAPVPWTLLWPQPWTFEQNDQTFLYTDEDLWQQPTVWPVPVPAQPVFDTPEYVFQPDEDYWSNQVVQSSGFWTAAVTDDSDFVIQVSTAVIEDEYWILAPTQTVYTAYQITQYGWYDLQETPIAPPAGTQLYTISLLGAGPA